MARVDRHVLKDRVIHQPATEHRSWIPLLLVFEESRDGGDLKLDVALENGGDHVGELNCLFDVFERRPAGWACSVEERDFVKVGLDSSRD